MRTLIHLLILALALTASTSTIARTLDANSHQVAASAAQKLASGPSRSGAALDAGATGLQLPDSHQEIGRSGSATASGLVVWVHNANCGPKTPINRGQSKAPKTSEPNSIYEKQNAHGGNDVVSRTFYDDNGRPFARQDFEPGHGVPGPHEHNMTFSPDGRPLTPETVGPVPPGYYPEPTP